jgi:hypothetical protein
MAEKDSAQRKCACGAKLFEDNGDRCDVCEKREVYERICVQLKIPMSPEQRKELEIILQKVRRAYFDAKWVACYPND